MMPAPTASQPFTVDVVSDVVCPWCYIGKRRLERALNEVKDIAIDVRWHPFFLNPWVPREGISREQYLITKFGSVEAYGSIAERVVEAAASEGLEYHPALVKRQPNTIDCHRLIHWAADSGQAAPMKQRLMELYFREGGDLTDRKVLVQAAADCGLDADVIRQKLMGEDDVDLISQQAQAAAQAGVTGVPTFILANTYGISGAQPAEQLASAIRQVVRQVAAKAADTPPAS